MTPQEESSYHRATKQLARRVDRFKYVNVTVILGVLAAIGTFYGFVHTDARAQGVAAAKAEVKEVRSTAEQAKADAALAKAAVEQLQRTVQLAAEENHQNYAYVLSDIHEFREDTHAFYWSVRTGMRPARLERPVPPLRIPPRLLGDGGVDGGTP